MQKNKRIAAAFMAVLFCASAVVTAGCGKNVKSTNETISETDEWYSIQKYKIGEQYIKDKGFRDTLPPDGGVTVSVIQKTDKDAPHSTDTSWGKHFGWYDFENGKPLLVFPLDDCTDMAWYGPEK